MAGTRDRRKILTQPSQNGNSEEAVSGFVRLTRLL